MIEVGYQTLTEELDCITTTTAMGLETATGTLDHATSLSTHASNQDAEYDRGNTSKINEYNARVRRLVGVNFNKVSPLAAKSCEELKSWFHGPMDRFKAVPLLPLNGDFLVRLAKSMEDATYKPVLSVKWDDRHYHFLIKERFHLFWVERLQFSSILNLCKYYLQSNEVITKSSGVKLLHPIDCPLWNPAIAREQRSERQLHSGSAETAEPPMVTHAKSLTYVVFGEKVPYVINYAFALFGVFIVMLSGYLFNYIFG